MPSIYNVGNNYSNNTKKISSKLSFDVGEKFSGKIVKSDNGEVKIRLRDGWEFPADIEGNIENLENVLQKFTVEGYENGRLKLKLIKSDKEELPSENKDIIDIISKEGLKKSDEKVLKTMIKFNIPLTKENIKEIKGMLQFLDKVKDNPEAKENFIIKYLESKGINIGTEKGNAAYKVLNSFLNEYSSLSQDDVLMFLENNIEMNTENIEAYKNLLKSDNNIESLIKNIKNFIESNKGEMSLELKDNNLKNLIPDDINFSNNKLVNNKADGSIENKLANNIYQKNEVSNNKVSVLSLLKTLSGESEDLLKGSLKDILYNRRLNFTSSEYEKASNTISNLTPEEFIKEVKEFKKEYNAFSGNSNNFADDFDAYLGKNNNDNLNTSFKAEANLTKGQLETLLSGKLGRPVKLSESEYSKLKEIINFKNQEIEENNLLRIDNKEIIENKDVNSNNRDLNSQGLNNKEIIENSNELFGTNKEILDSNKSISKEGLNPKDIALNKEVLTSKEQVTNSLNKVSEDNKSILKDVISILKAEGDIAEKLLSVIKENVSDVKVFNKLSEEYYYANVPVKVNNEEYPCKLIVKDKRKDGKKLDSKNIKMIVTVDTKNIGNIEGYLTLLERKLNIELKCNETYAKLLNNTKDKLTTVIENLGFNVSINVVEKKEDVNLSTCRDFFNTGTKLSLDRRV